MVNAKFPRPSRYGFERVDAANAIASTLASPSMENLRRIKSAVFFAYFLRFKTMAKTADLSTAASKKADCEGNRNGD
jgi:hypothetical protein